MAQHDYNIANQGFPATRADINNALAAIVSNNSGTSAPSTTFANQWWYDTTNDILYIRNEANDAWIKVATLDQTNDAVGTIHTDEILEGVSGNGVTIDGVVAKDSIIQASGQPSFRASRTAGTTSAGSAFVFNTVHHNNGSHYDNTTGVFTAPVTGYYYIAFQTLLNNSNAAGSYYSHLVSNGNKNFAYVYAAANTFAAASVSAVLYLAASDTVYVRAGAGTWYGTLAENTIFSGHLIS